jgi:DNA-binding transcriptional MerR regulator
MPQPLTIGRLARGAGLSAKTIRYYEGVGVLPRPGRTAAGYRQYTDGAIERVRFIRRARALGLSLEELQRLGRALATGRSGSIRPRLREVVRKHLSAVQHQIGELELLRGELQRVLERLAMPAVRSQRTRGGAARAGSCRCLEIDAETLRQ